MNKKKEQTALLQNAQKAVRRAKGIEHVALLLAQANTRERVAEIIVNEGLYVLEAHNGDLSLLGENGTFGVIAAKGYPKNFPKDWSSLPESEALLTTEVIKTKKPLYIKDASTLPKEYHVAAAFIKASGAKSAVLLPLKERHRVLGILEFTFTTPQTFNKEEKIFMNTLANQCALSLERVTAQTKLRESKEQLEIILKNTADAVIVRDFNRMVVYANDAGTKLLGKPELVNNRKASLVQFLSKFEITDEQGNLVKSFWEPPIVKKTKKNPPKVFKFTNKQTGRILWFMVKVSLIYNESGTLMLIINSLQDITTVKELDLKKDEFINMVSHELKTPLTSIHLLLDLLTSPKTVDTDRSAFYLDKVKQQVRRLQRLVSDLLNASRVEQGKLRFHKERFRLDELVRDTVAELQLTTSFHEIQITATFPCLIYADRLRIYQVVTNFLTNAIRYSPNGKKIIVSFKKTGANVLVRVQDFGIGVSKEHQQRIFDRFYQVSDGDERTYSGLGMGLYITREIIHAHDGTIGMVSRKGHGSTFYFSLPLAEGSRKIDTKKR